MTENELYKKLKIRFAVAFISRFDKDKIIAYQTFDSYEDAFDFFTKNKFKSWKTKLITAEAVKNYKPIYDKI